MSLPWHGTTAHIMGKQATVSNMYGHRTIDKAVCCIYTCIFPQKTPALGRGVRPFWRGFLGQVIHPIQSNNIVINKAGLWVVRAEYYME